MLYKLIIGSTRLPDAEGNPIRYSAWENNILDLTKEQAKAFGRRVVPLSEVEDEVEEEVVPTPRRKRR